MLSPHQDVLVLILNLLLSYLAPSRTYPEHQRREEGPSTAPLLSNPSKVAVTPSTEAFVYVCWEKCYNRWIAQYKWKYIDGNQGRVPTYKKTEAWTLPYKGKYSDNCIGQSTYESWSADGIDLYEDFSDQVRENREKNHDDLVQIETTMIKILQEDYKAKEEERLKNQYGSDSEAYQVAAAAAKRKLEQRVKKAASVAKPQKRRRLKRDD